VDNYLSNDLSGEVKRPINDSDSDILTGYQNPHHVEPVTEFRSAVSSRPGQLPALALVDRLHR